MNHNQSLNSQVTDIEAEVARYLVFRVGGEPFATRLADIREIVQPSHYRPVPHTIDAFLGVMNLRGKVVGVVDLRRRFKVNVQESRYEALLVTETAQGLLAAVVDRAERVVSLKSTDIAPHENVATIVPQQYLRGIARDGNMLMPVVDLQQILAIDDLVIISNLANAV